MTSDDVADDFEDAKARHHMADSIEETAEAERDYYRSIIEDEDVELLGIVGIMDSDSPKPAVVGGLSNFRNMRENNGRGMDIAQAIVAPSALAYAFLDASVDSLGEQLPRKYGDEIDIEHLIGGLLAIDDGDPETFDYAPDAFSDAYKEHWSDDADSGDDFVDIFIGEGED